MNRELNFLHFPTRYFPAISGAELYFQRISEILKKNSNFNIDIFCSDALDFSAIKSLKGKKVSQNSRYYSSVNNLKIKRFPIIYNASIHNQMSVIENNHFFKKLNISRDVLKSFIENGPNICEVLDYCETEIKDKYDLIHTTYIPYLNVLLSLIMGKMWRIPTICTPFFHFENPRYRIPYYLELLKKFDVILCCTHLEKQFLVNQGIKSKKIDVIPMGIDLEIYEKSTLINFKKKYFGENKKSFPMILFCGYKNFEKGALSLLKTIPMIIKKNKNILFTFIGPSTEAYNLELKKIKKQYKFENIVNISPSSLSGYYDKQKLSAFRECDIFVMPSRSDAFGIAFLEAWAFKKPVIGVKIGSTPAVIDDGNDGLLAEFDNKNELFNKIIFLLENKKYAESLGSRGYEKLKEKKYIWEEISMQISNIYIKLIESNTY